MFAIVTPNRAFASLPDISSRFAAAVRAFAVGTFERVFDLGRARWHSLNERLLRDSGSSPVEAEIARLRGRWGVFEAIALDPRANRGLGVKTCNAHCAD